MIIAVAVRQRKGKTQGGNETRMSFHVRADHSPQPLPKWPGDLGKGKWHQAGVPGLPHGSLQTPKYSRLGIPGTCALKASCFGITRPHLIQVSYTAANIVFLSANMQDILFILARIEGAWRKQNGKWNMVKPDNSAENQYSGSPCTEEGEHLSTHAKWDTWWAAANSFPLILFLMALGPLLNAEGDHLYLPEPPSTLPRHVQKWPLSKPGACGWAEATNAWQAAEHPCSSAQLLPDLSSWLPGPYT